MPKDAKKFINPLLRSSQDVDSKQDPISDAKLLKVALPVTPLSVDPSAVQAITEDVTFLPTLSAVDSAPPVSDQEDDQFPSPDISVPIYTSTSVSSDTLSSTHGNFVDRDALLIVSSHNAISQNEQTFPALSAEISEKQPVRELPVPNHKAGDSDLPATFSSPTPRAGRRIQETPSYTDTATLELSRRKSVEHTVSSSYESVRQQKLEHHVASERARHKRGELAFEQTHERITLWINKSLKQAFEDLAYEQDFSKTSLLNEAIADLLKKYEVH